MIKNGLQRKDLFWGIADGLMEIGSRVPLDELKEKMEDWFRRKSYLRKGSDLQVTELEPG